MTAMPRTLLLGALATLLLSGCSARVQNMVNTAKTAFFGHQDVELSVERVNAYPYAAAYVKTDNFPQAIAVLDRFSGEQRVYRTGGDEAITTRFGRVISSAGIPGMPLHTFDWRQDPLACHVQQQHRGSKQLCPREWQRTVEIGNYGENDVRQVSFDSTFTVGNTIDYVHPDGTPLQAVIINEQGQAGNRAFRNEFYAVAGRIVYAKQWVSTELGYVTWREMKPFSGDLSGDRSDSNGEQQ